MPAFPDLCLTGIRHDVRLMLQLTAFELRHFLILCDYARDRRGAHHIPARKREELRLILGFSAGKGRERLECRLRCYEGLGLIQIEGDGTIHVTYLIERWEGAYEDEKYDDSPPPPRQEPNGNGSYGGNGSQANGRQGDGYPGGERRQPGRTYSMDPAAVRKRSSRGQGAGENQNVTGENQNVTENVTPFESKRHASGPQGGQYVTGNVTAPAGQNVTGSRDILVTPLAGASDVLTSSRKEDNLLSLLPEDAKTSDAREVSQNVTANVTANVTGRNVTAQAPPENVTGPDAPTPPDRPAPRPGFEKLDLTVQCEKDVDAVMAITSDPPYRPSWRKAWRHCQASGALDCWDEAVEVLRARVARAAPPGDPDHLPRKAYGASLRQTMQNKLRDAGCPLDAGTAEERSDARAGARASLLAAELPPEAPPVVGPPAPPPSGGGITSLDDVYTEGEEWNDPRKNLFKNPSPAQAPA